MKITGISIWKIFAYFIIYSFLGFIIESTYALVLYGVIESRQSFLYGPFCAIYGLGAVLMICSLKKIDKSVHALFLGGFIVGGVTEYVISFLGEKLLNTRWWDYSNRFLNLNGRICFAYCIFWGLLAVYLLKVVNPKVDQILDWIKLKTKGKLKLLKALDIIMIIFLFLDFLITGIASDCYFNRITVENDLPVANKEKAVEKYNFLYKEHEELSNIIYKFWGNEKMVKTLPNATIMLENGDSVLAKNYSPDIKPYYFKFKD